MKINYRNYNPEDYGIKKLQEGGTMEEAPVNEAPAEGQDATQQILQACQQAVQSGDCNIAMQVCQALLQMAGQSGAPAAPEGQPVYRAGGKFSRYIKK